MGDHGQSFVRSDIDIDAALELAEVIRAWLIEYGIIVPETDDSVLSGDHGHRPGPNWAKATSPTSIESDPQFLTLRTNGVRLSGGSPQVVCYPNGADLTPSCPSCHRDVEPGPISDALWAGIDTWYKSDGSEIPVVSCVLCAEASPVLNYDFGDAMAFSLLDVTFWNWPPFNTAFRDEVLHRVGGNGAFAFGKL